MRVAAVQTTAGEDRDANLAAADALVAEAAAAGAPIAYGPSISANYRRAADYVDRILRGANAADLPIEQPIRIELIVNTGAAKALGLQLPLMIMARADEVIE